MEGRRDVSCRRTRRAAWEAQQKLLHAGFRFCLIGGLALQRWGEARYTQDVDRLGGLTELGELRMTWHICRAVLDEAEHTREYTADGGFTMVPLDMNALTGPGLLQIVVCGKFHDQLLGHPQSRTL